MILLDTHIFVWWQDKPEKLSARYTEILDSTTEEIAISAITTWEISMLMLKNRLVLPDPCPIWMRNVAAKSGVILLPLSLEVVEQVHNLPKEFHPDPADRIIAATTLTHKIKLATTDGKMTAYSFLDIL